jgi:hypothetical protein
MSYPIPTPETDSYGTVAGVEAYVGVYTDDGFFNMTTVPTNLTVIHWIDQVSDMFNVALATAGFQTPITQVDAAAAIGMAVEQLVADLAHFANSKGRFLSKGFQEKGGSVMGQVWKEIEDWVSSHSIGFINLGVPRVTGTLGIIGSKGIDAAGETITPIFQRKGFGNKFTDWTRNG